jgi:hypothetical protein
MNPEIQPTSSMPASPNLQPLPVQDTGGGKGKKTLKFLLVVLLVGGALAGGYVYGKGQDKMPSQISKTTSTPPPTKSASEVHFVQSEGHPFDIGAKKTFTTKLGIPADLQAARMPSDNGNPGSERYFTDKYNDELGRWIIGTPQDPSNNGGGYSEASVLAISKSWLAANLPADLADDSEFATGYKISTAADKQKFLQTLKSTTQECVKDAKKGFTTSDGSFKVCYTLNFGKEGYSPSIILNGYGEKESVPLYFTGRVDIYDSTPMANQDAELKAIADAKNAKYTVKFSASLDSLLAALKQTSLTTADNPSVTSR